LSNQPPKVGNLDKVGYIIAAIATLCLLGFQRVINLLTSWGLGGFLNRLVLGGVLLLALLMAAAGLTNAFRLHQNRTPLILHLAGSLLLVVFTLLIYYPPPAWFGLVLISAAAFLKLRCVAKITPEPQQEQPGS